MEIGFYAGSFDPFTNGHLYVITQTAKLFDKVIVGIGVNPEKKRRFDRELMQEAIEQVLASNNLNNVTVISYNNLSAVVAKEYHTTFLIRGIRSSEDYEYEEKVATVNQKISGIDTIYIRSGNLGKISSSLVMELLRNNQDVSEYVPKEILELIKK